MNVQHSIDLHSLSFIDTGCRAWRCGTCRTAPRGTATHPYECVDMRCRAVPYGGAQHVAPRAALQPVWMTYRIAVTHTRVHGLNIDCICAALEARSRLTYLSSFANGLWSRWVQSMAPIGWLAAAAAAAAWKACSRWGNSVGRSAGEDVTLGVSFTAAFVQSVTEVIDRRTTKSNVSSTTASSCIASHGGDRSRPPKASLYEKYNHIMRKIL